jgi:hypothetical protein
MIICGILGNSAGWPYLSDNGVEVLSSLKSSNHYTVVLAMDLFYAHTAFSKASVNLP